MRLAFWVIHLGPIRTSKVFLINFLKQLSSQFHANPTNPAVFLQAHKHNADKTEYWNQRWGLPFLPQVW